MRRTNKELKQGKKKEKGKATLRPYACSRTLHINIERLFLFAALRREKKKIDMKKKRVRDILRTTTICTVENSHSKGAYAGVARTVENKSTKAAKKKQEKKKWHDNPY